MKKEKRRKAGRSAVSYTHLWTGRTFSGFAGSGKWMQCKTGFLLSIRAGAVCYLSLIHISSYRTRLEQWKAEGQKTGKPYLKSEQYAMTVFYHDVMYRENTEEKLSLIHI